MITGGVLRLKDGTKKSWFLSELVFECGVVLELKESLSPPTASRQVQNLTLPHMSFFLSIIQQKTKTVKQQV
jgi:hypothetical protein